MSHKVRFLDNEFLVVGVVCEFSCVTSFLLMLLSQQRQNRNAIRKIIKAISDRNEIFV